MSSGRRRGRPGGLRFQLLFGLIVLLGLALLLVALGTLQLHKRQLQQLKAGEARDLVALLENSSREQNSLLEVVGDMPRVRFVGTSAAPEGIPTIPDQGGVILGSLEEEPVLIARGIKPLQRGGEVLLILSLDDANAHIQSSRQALTLYLGLTLFFICLVGFAFFSFVVIRPLRALSVATERAAQGDLASPVQLLPRNELGSLGHQFNQMLERLEEQRRALQEQLCALERAHRELQETQDSLIRSEKLATVGQLAAGVAHEVGNPLAAVMGYTELLHDGGLDEESAQEIAERSLVQLKRMRSTIRQLLDYSRDESSSAPRKLHLPEIIAEAIQLAQTTEAARGVTITYRPPDSIPPPVEGVPGELTQVLINLLFNALRVLKSHGEVKIWLAVAPEEIEIHIQDTGPGVPKYIASRIFDPFFTTSEPGDGTGLGLAISQRLIARMKGTLELLSTSDGSEGAHFAITLPSARPDEERGPSSKENTHG